MNKEQLIKQAEAFHCLLESARQIRDYAAAKNAAEHLAEIYNRLNSGEEFWQNQ
jgi:hypothetical protein